MITRKQAENAGLLIEEVLQEDEKGVGITPDGEPQKVLHIERVRVSGLVPKESPLFKRFLKAGLRVAEDYPFAAKLEGVLTVSTLRRW